MSDSNITLKASAHQELPGRLLPVNLLHFLIQQRLDFGGSVRCISYGFKSISIPSKVLYPQHIYDYVTPDCRHLFGKTLPEALILQTQSHMLNLNHVPTPVEISDTM